MNKSLAIMIQSKVFTILLVILVLLTRTAPAAEFTRSVEVKAGLGIDRWWPTERYYGGFAHLTEPISGLEPSRNLKQAFELDYTTSKPSVYTLRSPGKGYICLHLARRFADVV